MASGCHGTPMQLLQLPVGANLTVCIPSYPIDSSLLSPVHNARDLGWIVTAVRLFDPNLKHTSFTNPEQEQVTSFEPLSRD